ncbi:MAG TPA: carbohydrate ABC transporter permease [Candidatus Limnocylindrales bacterium]|jgi:arabinogalactan oligomer/maltooligosaccharide transport system permease protein
MTAVAGIEKARTVPVARTRRGGRGRLSGRQQVLLQVLCLVITATVLFPILWIFSLALDPRNISRPDGLIPPGASLAAFARVIAQPTTDEISLLELARNSLLLASAVALFSVGIGVLAAYCFSRLRFRGRELLMIAILGVLMLPAVATIAPLFILLNSVKGDFPIIGEVALRTSLVGVGLAIVSGTLPFAIWNLKGYLDTIPKELEEAAAVDGCTTNQSFFKIVLPLATPALAVTGFLGFIAGWTDFYFPSIFLNDPDQGYTLSLALAKMVGAFGQTPWSDFAAFAILFAAPVSIVFFFFQRYIVGGLAVGGVKG